jgi:hypothetical protein
LRRESNKKKKIEERVLSDRLLLSQEKVEELKKALARSSELESEKSVDQEVVQAPLEQIDDQPEEDEKSEKNDFRAMQILCESYMSNNTACLGLSSMNPHKLDEFVKECSPALDNTTYKGTQQTKPYSSTPIPHHSFIFLTLF